MKKVLVACFLVCTSLFSDESLLREISKGFANVANSAIPAVVCIESQSTQTSSRIQREGPFQDPFDYFSDDFFKQFFGFQSERRPGPAQARGSGFIVSSDGLIMTNNHVVDKCQKVVVTLHDGRKMPAEVIGTDPRTDIAIIKIEEKNLPYLKFGDSNKLQVGDWTIAIGNPFGLQASLTVGVVSAKGRNQLQITDFEEFIQTDAAINPGNSGGPLLNVEGEVIGVNTAIASASGGYMGIGFAIPSTMATKVQEQLVKDGTVKRGFLGITLQPIDCDLAKFYHLDRPRGALVTDVVAGSPAEKAGLKQEDIILSYNGKEVEGIHGFRNEVSLMAPGSKVKLEILRDGKKRMLTVKIGDAPGSEVSAIGVAKKLGFRVEAISDERARQLNLSKDEGVLITEVSPDTPAALAGLRPGFVVVAVNRKRINSLDEFNKEIDEASGEGRVLLMLRQGDAVRFVALHFTP